MNVEIIELNDLGTPAQSHRFTLVAVPQMGELIALGDQYFEVVNVVHKIDASSQMATVFARPTRAPYQEPKSRFGFGSR